MQSNSILLVSSHGARTNDLRSNLESSGYAVTVATDGPTAIAAAAASDFALVITDLYVPVNGSRCLVRRMRKTAALDRTRILAYTAHGNRKDRSWAKRAGANGYVITRSGQARLMEVVGRLMSRARLSGGPYADTA